MRLLSFHSEQETVMCEQEIPERVSKKSTDSNTDKTLISPDAGFFEMKMHMTPDTTPSSETPGTTSLLSEDLMSLSLTTTADDAFTPSESTDVQLEITEILNNMTNLMLNSDLQQDQAASDNNANMIDNTSNSNEGTATTNRVQFLLPNENQNTGAKRKWSTDSNSDHGKESDSTRTKRTLAKDENNKAIELKDIVIEMKNTQSSTNEEMEELKAKDLKPTVDISSDFEEVKTGTKLYKHKETTLSKKANEDVESAQLLLLDAGVKLKSRGRSEHGHSSDSTVQKMLYSTNCEGEGDGTKLRPKSTSSEPVLGTNQEFGLIGHHSLGLLKPRGRSIHGHASDSTIQKMMYCENENRPEKEAKEVPVSPRKTDQFSSQLVQSITPYRTKFNFYDLGASDRTPVSSVEDDVKGIEADFVGMSLPLSVMIEQSLILPIQTQIELVNQSLVDYFLVDMKLLRHLETIRDYILLNDGEFAQVMADQLFEQVSQGVKPVKLLNPKNLTSILTKALDSSLCNDDMYTKNLSFALTSFPLCFLSNVPAPFPGLELQYRTEWPLNLIITPECLKIYNQIFHFILKIRHLHWALTDAFYHLKKSARIKKATFSPQFSQMQLFRHEMHHFVRVIQTYVCNQVLQVSWSEFLHDIEHNVHNLDDLMGVHQKYLQRSLTRCLLNSKAAPVRTLMQNVFSVALQFHTHMTSTVWQLNPKTGALEHPAFWQLTSAYKRFQERTAIFYSAVEKYVNLGYRPFWRDLLMKMNYNDFYSKQDARTRIGT